MVHKQDSGSQGPRLAITVMRPVMYYVLCYVCMYVVQMSQICFHYLTNVRLSSVWVHLNKDLFLCVFVCLFHVMEYFNKTSNVEIKFALINFFLLNITITDY